MEGIYRWVQNITYYMIFITAAANLLADSKYEKYLRFFGGIVLVLLVVQPLTGSLRLEERLTYLFQSFTFKQDSADFEKRLTEAKRADPERKIAVEAADIREGLAFAAAGADIIQCEKFSVETLTKFVTQAKQEFPQLIISAAGGINAANARAYAQTGVDFLVTTWPYFGKPADVKMQILAEDS